MSLLRESRDLTLAWATGAMRSHMIRNRRQKILLIINFWWLNSSSWAYQLSQSQWSEVSPFLMIQTFKADFGDRFVSHVNRPIDLHNIHLISHSKTSANLRLPHSSYQLLPRIVPRLAEEGPRRYDSGTHFLQTDRPKRSTKNGQRTEKLISCWPEDDEFSPQESGTSRGSGVNDSVGTRI